MLDFYKIVTTPTKKALEVSCEFKVKKSRDLMIRGGVFYAVWDEELGYWNRNEMRVQEIVDNDILKMCDTVEGPTNPKLLSNYSTHKWDDWKRYVKSLADNYTDLDNKIIFSNSEIKKEDYASKSLPYPLSKGSIKCWNEIISTLYQEDERKKIEWFVGAIISGDSINLQKFLVFYGGPGTGKSTIINIIYNMFESYASVFDSKELGSNSTFALEAFSDNPLVSIQHDGDLSRIEDNTKINSIVSHETMLVNEKYRKKYSTRFNTVLIMGTNKPVKITDSKSGILRRLIDVSPTGYKIPSQRYLKLMSDVKYEYGAIAYHCLKTYEKMGLHYYDTYTPFTMIENTNDLYNFIEDNYDDFKEQVTLVAAWARYKDYCEDANIQYKLTKRIFKEELKTYYNKFIERTATQRNIYAELKKDKFKYEEPEEKFEPMISDSDTWLHLDQEESEFDYIFKDCPAQRTNSSGKPLCSWDKCTTTLKDIDTKEEHYVRTPSNIIFLDFDLKDEEGNKCKELNIKAANKYPPTYAEYSKSGEGLHLYYIYEGDVNELARVIDKDIEVKITVGNSSTRRKLSKCNNLPIATISSGLPKKEVKMIQNKVIKDEKHLRACIKKALRKEVHANTTPNMNYILGVLDDAYSNGIHYDVTDMRPSIEAFAMCSTHQADYCNRLLSKMHFMSDDISDGVEDNTTPIVFFDVEVFPNLFIVAYKKQGKDNEIYKLINPSPDVCLDLTRFRLVGFNNRSYDNHILYARIMGYTVFQLYKLSQRLISDDIKVRFGEAYNLSYTDIYDYLSASNKMSLKKWEIQLHIHHQELGYDWNEPVPEEKWSKVAEYCGNDVEATEAVWDATQSDWVAREILSDLSGLTKNDTTNHHTTKIIVGNDKNPQRQYVYYNLSNKFPGYEYSPYGIDKSRYKEGVKIIKGKSIYKGEDPGEGGYAMGVPGLYFNAAVLDIASMHPHSAIAMNVFGDIYTKRFKDLVDARIAIKHEDFDSARNLLDGLLIPYIEKIERGEISSKDVANALKTAINSVYGLTSARFDNKLKDPKNVDNIVAKYGALFMLDLKEAVINEGYTVIHIKTDSIKIAEADNYIINFVMEFGKKYGYTFEHEGTYERIFMENDAVFIAKYASADWCLNHYDYIPGDNKKKEGKWTATGTKFQIPYVFKKLFSHEEIDVYDLCETKSASTALYLDFNEGDEENHNYSFVGKVGSFMPVKGGEGGGILLRQKGDKYDAVQNTKRPKGDPYRWYETEEAIELNKDIDYTYWDNKVDDAVEAISKYCDFNMFVNGEIIA